MGMFTLYMYIIRSCQPALLLFSSPPPRQFEDMELYPGRLSRL